MKKIRNIEDLKRKVFDEIGKGKISTSLKIIEEFVEFIITEPICTSRVFGSKSLDDLCQYIGNVNLNKLSILPLEKIKKNNKDEFVYIVTKIQKSGGHTKIIKDFISARSDAKHVILSTGLSGKSEASTVLSDLIPKLDVVFDSAPKGDLQCKLTWLQSKLISLQPSKIYLFNHHQDSVAIAAVQPEMGFELSFYHHADHHLCLGVYLPFGDHIDPHPMGFYKCNKDLKINNIYLPLAVEDRGYVKNKYFIRDGKLITCTAARSNKVEIPYTISYLDFIPKLLKTTDGKHIHIGRLSFLSLCKLRYSLWKSGIKQNKFLYISWVPSVWDALNKYNVDLYIASFPYGGGLTMIEAMGAGVPIALHKHIYSRVLSGIDLAYPDAFFWRNIQDVLDFCKELDAKTLSLQSGISRKHYEEHYSFCKFKDLLKDKNEKSPVPEIFYDKYEVDRLEMALLFSNQFSFTSVLSRNIYRKLRSIRSFISRNLGG